jgi:hypothetical protein
VVSQLRWYDHNADNPPWVKALAEVRNRATGEGYCYQHVQATIVSIDQCAEAARGNRQYFLNKPHALAADATITFVLLRFNLGDELDAVLF